MLNSMVCNGVPRSLLSVVIFDYFRSEGTITSSREKLNTFASGVLICYTIFLSSVDACNAWRRTIEQNYSLRCKKLYVT